MHRDSARPGVLRGRDLRQTGTGAGSCVLRCRDGSGRCICCRRGPPGRVRVLAATPYMGWNTYYGVGGVFDQATIISVARALLGRGLARAGYRIVWLDFGWASGSRDQSGALIVDRSQWPNGLRWLTGW